MSERIKISISGITTTSEYNDGDSYSLVNLRPKNGYLHPVPPRKVIKNLSRKYDLIFVHHNNNYENWIGIIIDDLTQTSSVYNNIKNENPNLISTFRDIIHTIEQVGNTLTLISENSLYYLLYTNSIYKILGEMPDLPPISFTTYEDITFEKSLKFKDEYPSITINKTNFYEYTQSLANKIINDSRESSALVYLFDAVFVRYAFRLFDGTLIKHSPPILIMPPVYIPRLKTIMMNIQGDRFSMSEASVRVKGYNLGMNFDFRIIDPEWKDLIKSIDLFMSAPLGLTNLEKDYVESLYKNSDSNNWQYVNLSKGDYAYVSNICDEGKFYFIKEFSLDEYVDPGSFLKYPQIRDNYQGTEILVQQELMSDDNFSNHKIGSKTSYTYNNRIHIADLKTSFFKGFDARYFNWKGNYNGGGLWNTGEFKYLYIVVSINTGSSIFKVYSESSNIFYLFMSSFISYPDSRAFLMEIYSGGYDSHLETPKKLLKRVSLKPHKTLNLAYYIEQETSDNLGFIYSIKPILKGSLDESNLLPDKQADSYFYEPNKLKVSELNNPLQFPLINTYQVGSGQILSMATNTLNVTDRNYGQYPLYIFTTQGIWTLNVGTEEVVYSSQSSPTYTEAPTTPIVCPTPYGVAFTSKRGLMIINGQSVEFLSPQLEEAPLFLNIETNEACSDVLLHPEYNSFPSILLNIKHIIYNPYENELIVNTKDSNSNLILNITNNLFYQSTEKIDQVVGNVFPNLFVIHEDKLKDYASAHQSETHISLILRPVNFGTPDIKKLERMILRGIFYSIKNPILNKFSMALIHSSNDNINFPCMRGISVKGNERGNLKDIDLGLMGSTKYRNFLFSFAGVIDSSSQIQYLESMINKEYNNSKMR